MKFEPQCTTLKELYRRWADVLEMCEGTEVRPKDGWKYERNARGYYPPFNGFPEYYEFSISIVEGKHVFRGDTLYNGLGLPFIVSGICNAGTAFSHDEPVGNSYYATNIDTASWNPPKQEPTFPERRNLNKDEGYDVIAYKITKKYKSETVMVELPIKNAKEFAEHGYSILGNACHKALEKR